MKEERRGVLYLIPTSLGAKDSLKFKVQSSKFGVEDINERLQDSICNADIINRLDEFIVENERTARRELKEAGYKKPINEIKFHILNEHTRADEYESYLESAKEGKSIGLLSESGCPCIADPGKEIVSAAHTLNIRVLPLVGPSSIILGLMASGFNGQNFAFRGYLPVKQEERVKAIKELEAEMYRKDQTQIFIEAPYRNVQLFEVIVRNCSEQTRLCLATDLTMPTESILSMSIKNWKKVKPDINKKPTVFLLYK